MISENNSVDSLLAYNGYLINYLFIEVINYRKTQLKMKNKLTNMSPQVKKRVRALKNLMVAQDEIKLRFLADTHLLQLKYQKEYEPYFNKETDIIQGKYEPVK